MIVAAATIIVNRVNLRKLRIDRGRQSGDFPRLTTMLLPVFRDLIKPQWLAVIELLKQHGGMPVSEIARQTGSSYMTVKSHCDQLGKAGYLHRTRLPRTEVGRPEIFYSLAAKADALFPQAGADFALDLLEELRAMHGESAPERLLFQHFAKTAARWEKTLEKTTAPAGRARKLAALRVKAGYACEFVQEPGEPARIVEYHNPLQRVFERFPRVIAMELRLIEQLLGCRVTRHEIPGGPETTPRVVFELC
jgi:predicted ArsR family transcriptional regulator